jgi:putative flippase GtrA
MFKKLTNHTQSNKITGQFLRFLVVGVTNTSLNYLIYLLALKVAQIYYIYSGILGFIVGDSTAFILNRAWTFKSNITFKKGFATYFAIQCFCLIIHVAIQFYTTEYFGIKKEYSQFPSIVVTMFLNFFLIRKFVFHKNIIE